MLYRLGYHCFLEGAKDALHPISGRCWDHRLESHRWSNVVCAHWPKVVRMMYGLASKT